MWRANSPILFLAPGLVHAGSTPGELASLAAGKFVRAATVLSWQTLVGHSQDGRLLPRRAEIAAEMRRSLPRDWVISQTATLLADAAWSHDGQRMLTRLAFRDDWPASVVESDCVADAVLAQNNAFAAVPATGLMALQLEALRANWATPANVRGDAEKMMRLCRLAMALSGVISDLSAQSHAGEPREEHYLAEFLLPSCRLTTREPIQSVLVRAHELYCDLLPTNVPAWTAKQAALAERIVGVSLLAQAVDLAVSNGNTSALSSAPLPDGTRPSASLERLLAALSMSDAEFAAAIENDASPFPYGAVARRPLLRAGVDKYVILNRSLLVAAADEFILRELAEDDADVRNHFGRHALEPFVMRALRRCVPPEWSVLRVPDFEDRKRRGLGTAGHVDRKRCDFAILASDCLILVDSKLLLAQIEAFCGVIGLREFFDNKGGVVVEQMLQTIEDIERLGLNEIIPDARAHDAPADVQAWLVSYQPLNLWFSDCEVLVRRSSQEARWTQHFARAPAFLSLRDLGLLEANEGALSQFAEARRNNDPRATRDIELFLADLRGPGFPTASRRVVDEAARLVRSLDVAKNAV